MAAVHPRLRRALAAASAVAICLAAATIKSALVTAHVDACGLVQVAGQPSASSTRPDSWVAAGPFTQGSSPSGWVGSGFLYEETDRAVYRDLSGVVIQLVPADPMPRPACP